MEKSKLLVFASLATCCLIADIVPAANAKCKRKGVSYESANCNFTKEGNFCGWNNITGQGTQWNAKYGYKANQFVSADMSGVPVDSWTRMTSPWFRSVPDRQYRLRFRYYIGSDDSCQLSVLIDTDVSTEVLWKTRKSRGLLFRWVHSLLLPSKPCRHRIIFEARKVSGGHCGYVISPGRHKHDEVDVDNILFDDVGPVAALPSTQGQTTAPEITVTTMLSSSEFATIFFNDGNIATGKTSVEAGTTGVSVIVSVTAGVVIVAIVVVVVSVLRILRRRKNSESVYPQVLEGQTSPRDRQDNDYQNAGRQLHAACNVPVSNLPLTVKGLDHDIAPCSTAASNAGTSGAASDAYELLVSRNSDSHYTTLDYTADRNYEDALTPIGTYEALNTGRPESNLYTTLADFQ